MRIVICSLLMIVVVAGATGGTSFYFDVRGLNDRPPPRNLVPLVVGKGPRRLLLDGRQLLPDIEKSLLGAFICQQLPDGGIESLRHVRRRPPWRPDGMPVEKVEPA